MHIPLLHSKKRTLCASWVAFRVLLLIIFAVFLCKGKFGSILFGNTLEISVNAKSFAIFYFTVDVFDSCFPLRKIIVITSGGILIDLMHFMCFEHGGRCKCVGRGGRTAGKPGERAGLASRMCAA